MFKFFNCFVVKTKHDNEYQTNIQYADKCTQCDTYVITKSVTVQCDKDEMCNVSVQCEKEVVTDAGTQCEITIPSVDVPTTSMANNNNICHEKNSKRLVFLRDKALSTIAFDLYENEGQKYIVIKNEQVFLRHIKGHYKFDSPWH